MANYRFLLIILFIVYGISFSYDPLYYNNLTSVLHSMESDGDVALGYFGANQYWQTDSLGNSELFDYSTGLGILRFQFAGRYGLTNSHTISIIIPGYLQIQGPSDTTGVGIADPWISLDGWISRSPMLIARGAIRIPFKGALESGNYSESDRHFAFDGAMTIQSPVSQGSNLSVEATAGLRYYLWAWDALHASRRDSAETKPPIELRLTGFFILPVNLELSLRIGGEIASRGETEAKINGNTIGQENSDFSQQDLRAGFMLNNENLNLTAEVFYRLGGENTSKEWGIMVNGTGIDFLSLFGSTSSSSGRRE